MSASAHKFPREVAAAKPPEEVLGQRVAGGFFISDEQLLRFGFGTDLHKIRRYLRMSLADEREKKMIRGPTEKPANVRIATEADEQSVFDLLMADLEENGADRIAPVSAERIIAHIQAGTRKRGGIVAVIDGPYGKPVACIVLVPMQWWWSKGYYVQDIVTFVHPDHRASDHAATLIKFARWTADQWTENWGYQVYILTGVLGIRRVREKIRLFRRLVTQCGAAFLYPAPSDMES